MHENTDTLPELSELPELPELFVLDPDAEEGEAALTLPPGILDSATWRRHVLKVLAAAGAEGMLVFDIVEALVTNFGQRFDWQRIEKWLYTELAAGIVITERDFWYLAEFADDVQGVPLLLPPRPANDAQRAATVLPARRLLRWRRSEPKAPRR